MLIRSAHLFQAEEKDLAGVAAIIDLRISGERKEAPDQTCGREYFPIPVFDDITAGISRESGASDSEKGRFSGIARRERTGAE